MVRAKAALHYCQQCQGQSSDNPRWLTEHTCTLSKGLTSARLLSRFFCCCTLFFIQYTASAAPMTRQPRLHRMPINAAYDSDKVPSLQHTQHEGASCHGNARATKNAQAMLLSRLTFRFLVVLNVTEVVSHLAFLTVMGSACAVVVKPAPFVAVTCISPKQVHTCRT